LDVQLEEYANYVTFKPGSVMTDDVVKNLQKNLGRVVFLAKSKKEEIVQTCAFN
jgi:hypothetical protein